MKKRIFKLNQLLNRNLEEDDLFYIFETNSLKYSLIYAMFEIAKYEYDEQKINSIIRSKNWNYKYFWTLTQRDNFRTSLINIYKNLYSCSDFIAGCKADEFLLFYGLTNSKLKPNKKIQTLEN